MAQNRFDEALEFAERSWGPQTPNRALRLDFIRAMVLKQQGRYDEAAAAMRAILAANPGFARVRAQLAHTLFLAGDYDAARFHFTDLSRNALSSEARQAFEAYLSATRLRQPYRLGGYVSLAPSTNVNRGTSTRVILIDGQPFVLSDDTRAKSGIGLSGGLSGERHFFFDNDVTLTFAGRFDGTKYRERDYDRFQLGGGVHLRRKDGRNSYGVGLLGDYFNHGHSTMRHGVGAEVEFGRSFEKGRYVFASARLMTQTFPASPVLDGYMVTANLIGRQALGPGQLLTAGVRLGFERTRAAHLDNDSVGLFIAHAREWQGGLITQVEPSVTVRHYRATDPTFAIRRRDTQAGGTVRVSHRKLNLKGFMPRVEYSYSRQFSNHPLHRRDNHGFDVVLTREF